MFKNYFITAFRNLKKEKGYSFIKIAGLAIGLAVCILLLLYVQDELSFDRFHKNADNVYRIINTKDDTPYIAPPLMDVIVDNFPEVKSATRIFPPDETVVEYKNEVFNERDVIYADASFFNIFSFDFVNGDPESALTEPFSIVITESMSKKYFGDMNAIGEVLRVENELDVTVTGVVADVPANSHFTFNMVVTLVNAKDIIGERLLSNWGWRNLVIYGLFEEGFSVPAFEEKCTALVEEVYVPDDANKNTYALQKLTDIHLYSSHINNDIQAQGDISYVLIFSGIGVLILLIACFNYIYLLMANANTRAVEVGIKKVIGATREQLTRQFFGESMAVLIISLLISLVLVSVSLPLFNNMTDKNLTMASLANITVLGSIIGMIVITGLIAGSYPAMLISRFQPIAVVKGAASSGKSKLTFNRILVVIQFTVSAILIICSVFMFKQLKFIQNKKLGFDKEHVVVLTNFEAENSQKYELLRNNLLQNMQVLSVAAGDRIPSGDLNNGCGFKAEGETEFVGMKIVHVTHDYFETIGITGAAAGRIFSRDYETDATEALVINQSAINLLKLPQDPIGNEVYVGWPRSNRTVVGVVKDFHFESLYKSIVPVAFVIHPDVCDRIMVKVNGANLETTLAYIEKTWEAIYPDWTYEFSFMNDRFEQIYFAEKRTFQLMGYFSLLAIFVAFLGLLGLASFTTKRRFKEIGLRKVLGASTSQMVNLLSKDIMKWVVIANVIAFPVAWYAMNKWFQHFAFHTEIVWWVFALAGVFTLAVAILTVGYQTVKAAHSNPVDALKYE